MVTIGVSIDGKPDITVSELDDGTSVPDASLDELEAAHQRTVREQIELGSFAEELGYSFITYPELHFSLLATQSASPLLTQMAIAQVTEEIQLLPGIVANWHHPLRIAEQVAMLDIVSDGRAQLQLTSEGREYGASAFKGSNTAAKLEQDNKLQEIIKILKSAWTDRFFSHDGRNFTFPRFPPDQNTYGEYQYLSSDRTLSAPEEYLTPTEFGVYRTSISVAPKPIQDPHPPLWREGASVEKARAAAAAGMNIIPMTRNFEKLQPIVESYYHTLERNQMSTNRGDDIGEKLTRGWDVDAQQGIGIPVSIFNTDVADAETIDRWKSGKQYVVNYIERYNSRSPKKVGASNPHVAIDKWDNPVVGSTNEIVTVFHDLCSMLQFDNALFVAIFDTHGITTEEKRRQMRSFAQDIKPALNDLL